MRLAAEAIAFFEAHTSDDMGLTISYDSPKSAGTAYLFDVAAISAREHRDIRPNVVRMVSESRWEQCYSGCTPVCYDILGSTTKGLIFFLLVISMWMIVRCPSI